MNNDINLVSNQDASSLKKKKQLRMARTGAVISLVTVAFFSVVIFIVNAQISLPTIIKDQNQTLNSISYLHKKAAELAIVNNRLIDINSILSQRKNYTSDINSLLQLVPSGVYVNTLQIDKSTITMVLSSNSLLSINTFLNGFIGLSQKQQIIKGIEIQSLSVNAKTGLYTLSITATII